MDPIARVVWTTSALVSTLVVVTMTGSPRVPSREQQRTSIQREAPVQSVKSKSDLRARTGDEKARAQFFDRYGADPLEPGDTAVIFPGPPVPPIPPGVPLPTLDQLLEDLACSAQVVVLGRAEQRAVHLNQRETYLFTDYEVEVEWWLRPGQGAAPLKVSVSGGRATIAGMLTIAGAEDPLQPTKRYIFFLQQIPGSGSLTPVRPPLADGDQWATAVLANASVQLDSLASDLARVGRRCAPGR
jgi:hypothetical protein